MSIAAVETAILSRARAVLGSAVVQYDTAPASIEIEAQLAARLKRLPAVLVAFLGGSQRDSTAVLLDASFAVVVLTASTSEKERREGSARRAGAIVLLEALLPALHAYVVPGIGSLTLGAVSNLFSPAFDERGITAYSATFAIRLPMLPPDPADLMPFLTLHGDFKFQGSADPAAPLPLPPDTSDAVEVVTYPPPEAG